MRNNKKGLIWYGVHMAAYVGLFLSLVFNVWSVEKFLAGDGELEWPHTLHVYLVQVFMLIISLLGLFLVSKRNKIEAWLFAINPRVQSYVLLAVLVFIELCLAMAFWLTKDHPGFSDLGYLFMLFNFNQEFNVPTLFSVAQIWLGAGLALLCAYRSKKYAGGKFATVLTWGFASFVLLVMGFDELLSIHENAGQVLQKIGLTGTNGGNPIQEFGYAWTLVALPLALFLSIFFILSFWKIFSRSLGDLGWLVLAGVTFITGAVFVENLQVYLQMNHDLIKGPSVYLLIEEILEMFGVSLAVMVFFRHARQLIEKDTK